VAVACSSEETETPTTTNAQGGAGGSGVEPVCSSPTEVPCSDAVILQMNLQADPAPGLITNAPDGDGFWTLVDATAGGAFATDPHSYVYGKFTAAGLEKVELSDEESLDSMDWDIAFRRYVVRINSGSSGPSCVTGARLAGTPDYDTVAAVPDTIALRADEYFTASPDCSLIPDGTGLPGSPATALSGFWTYSNCLAMSGNVYVLQLADGRYLKLVVTEYYYDAGAAEPGAVQEQCDTTDEVPEGDNGAANIHFRWAFLP
jgi:hypothetical protein